MLWTWRGNAIVPGRILNKQIYLLSEENTGGSMKKDWIRK